MVVHRNHPKPDEDSFMWLDQAPKRRVPFVESSYFDNEIEVEDSFNFLESQAKLEHKLASRLSREVLAELNIIKDVNVAPSLQATQLTLKKKKIEENLNHKLEHRPTVEDLISCNIIREEARHGAANSFQAIQQHLNFFKKLKLIHSKLDCRPTRSDLMSSNIIKGDIAPVLQSTQQTLKIKTISITLDHKLENRNRPQTEDLIYHNILKVFGNRNLAPSLQTVMYELRRQKAQSDLNLKLSRKYQKGSTPILEQKEQEEESRIEVPLSSSV